MTIQQFSSRTGLSPGTLRFYERKRLLSPSKRLENGYRSYTEDQVQIALMIQSLRQADISIQEIKCFLEADSEEKQLMYEKWHRNIEVKLSQMQVAKQYVNGLRQEELQVYLIHWDEPCMMFWFKHSVARKEHPFKESIAADLSFLEQQGVAVKQEAYVKVTSAKGDVMTGEVGFRLESDVADGFFDDLKFEIELRRVEPMLFASMECHVSNDFVCFRLTRLLQRYGFEPTDRPMNRFVLGNEMTYRMMIPVLQMASPRAEK